MKRNVLRKIVGGLSFTSALFIFQACYGTPQDFENDILIEGQVKAKTTGMPIEGIKVSINENMQYQMTDQEGKFSFYTQQIGGLTLQFHDVDSIQNGQFLEKDTALSGSNDRVFLEISLEEK